MAKTDGYITMAPNGDWRYSNTGDGVRGDIVSPVDLFSPAYMRLQRMPAGAIAGTKVDEQGVVSPGPIVHFDALNSLLDDTDEEEGATPWIVWAGVSPMSLSEVLIVWNKPIVMLDQAKVTGGSGIVGVAGRVMIVQLNKPLAIDGEEIKKIKIAPGAVGQYIDKAKIQCTPADNTTVNTPSGDLEPLEAPTAIGCNTPTVGAALGDEAGGTSANVLNATIFAEQLCQEQDCDPAQPEPDLGFVVNNGMIVPVRCCFPFMLMKLAINSQAEDCNLCPPCPLWMAALWVFGSTVPLEVFTVDQLLTIADSELTDFSHLFGASRQIAGVLTADANCCAICEIEIVGNAGPRLTIDGEWRGEILGVAGQPAYLSFKSKTSCSGVACQNVISADTPADTWTDEGIIKPIPRTLPVKFFAPLGFKTTDVTVPNFTTNIVTVITTCPMITVNSVSGTLTTSINNIVNLAPTGPLTAFSGVNIATIFTWLVSGPIIESQGVLHYDSFGTDFLVGTTHDVSVAACPGAGAAWLTGYGTTTIDICVGSSTSTITVITSIATAAVTCTSVTKIDTLVGVSQSQVKVFSTTSPDVNELHIVESDTPVTFTAYNITTAAVSVLRNVLTTPVQVVNDCLGNNSPFPVKIADIVIKGLSIVTTNPDIRIPIETTQGCDVEWKFVVHDGTPLKWTQIIADIILPCNPGMCDTTPQARRVCSKNEVVMTEEVNCKNVLLMRANYVSRAETNGTERTCPGYDCSPENGITPPKGSNQPNGAGGPVPCSILIRRPRRRPFLRCT